MASSELPGSLIVFERPTCATRARAATSPYPVLPAATTTTTPLRTSRSTSTHKGLWPRSEDTAHVYYYLDQKKTLYFAPGQSVRTQALSDDQVAFMRALVEGPRPVQQ